MRSKAGKIINRLPYFLENSKIEVTGCARSGTLFTSTIFSKLGIKFGHEEMGKDGIVSWFLVPEINRRGYLYFQSKKYRTKYVFHQVRHPLNTINSMQTSLESTWQYISKYIDISEKESLLLKGMKYWYYWNKMAEKVSCKTFRVENYESEFEDILRTIKRPVRAGKNKILPKIPYDLHSRKNRKSYDRYNWEDLKKEDQALYNKIVSLARKYGY